MHKPDIRYRESIGEGSATIRIRGQSAPRFANILGSQRLDDGRQRYWLDRLVHPGGELEAMDGVVLSGATSTIVTLPADLG